MFSVIFDHYSWGFSSIQGKRGHCTVQLYRIQCSVKLFYFNLLTALSQNGRELSYDRWDQKPRGLLLLQSPMQLRIRWRGEEIKQNEKKLLFSSITTEDIWFISSQQVFTVSLPFLFSAIVQVNWGFLSTKFHPKSDNNDSWEEGSQGLHNAHLYLGAPLPCHVIIILTWWCDMDIKQNWIKA